MRRAIKKEIERLEENLEALRAEWDRVNDNNDVNAQIRLGNEIHKEAEQLHRAKNFYEFLFDRGDL